MANHYYIEKKINGEWQDVTDQQDYNEAIARAKLARMKSRDGGNYRLLKNGVQIFP